jgi:hypothetical protein
MNEPAIRTSRSIGWIRFIVWIVPMCIAPFIVLGVVALAFPLGAVVLIGSIVALIYLARFDALLECQQRKIPLDDPRAKIGRKMMAFVVAQFMLVPVLWYFIVLVSVAIWGPPKIGC